ncbi:MAG TPA: flagellar hook-basal body protein [Firmicutes bacterium]|nr:flagellar hook-basal body protein [Bacillota bacterium]
MLWRFNAAACAMAAQQQRTDVIAHNVANVNTAGFRRGEVLFADLLYQSLEGRGRPVVPADISGQKPVTAGTGCRTAAIRTGFSGGALVQTDEMLHVAIVGDGFFRVRLPSGVEAYTRDGSFRRDSAGYLVTADGFRLALPPLPAPECEVAIAAGGEVAVTLPTGERQDLGRLELAAFANPGGLARHGDNLFVATENSGPPQRLLPGGQTCLQQGWLELANVDLATELTNLLRSLRAYQVSTRALQTLDEMAGIANQLQR